jgi:biotin carboxylase
MVLAASRYQIDTIMTAKRLGYWVITTDNVPSNPGHALADRAYAVDTTDREGILRVAREEGITGIIAPCTDVAVPTAAFVAEALGLPGPSLKAVAVTCDKASFRQFLTANDLPCPRTVRVTSPALPGDVDFSARAWIVKPSKSSGSKGVYIVRSAEEFAQRIPETLAFSPDGVALIEEYIVGAQGTCEGILEESDVAQHWILDRQTVSPPYVTTCGHHVPTRLPARLQKQLLELLRKIWALLGVTKGPFDCDFVATDDEIYILELTPRIGGNAISTLLRVAWEFDLVAYAVRYAAGQPGSFPAPESAACRPTAIVLLGVSNTGRLQYDLAEATWLRAQEWVHALSFDVELGDRVAPFINSRHRVGEAVVTGADRTTLDQRVEELKRRLAVRAV